jgi:ABC-type transport system involved in multi-copper enzyme maturation permease subunit
MDKLFKGGLILVAILMGYMIFESFVYLVSAQTTGTVTVTATVATSITCSLSTTITAFGTIGPSAVYTSSPNVTTTVACNPAAGCQVQVKDQGNGTNGGLYNSTANYLIPSPAAGFPDTATLVAGTEGYGIQAATTTAGSGGTLSLNSIYNQTGTTVGKLSITSVVLASSSQPVSNREVVVTHKAAVSGLTPAGSYQDTITYDCVSN